MVQKSIDNIRNLRKLGWMQKLDEYLMGEI
jgi:hypothetical protein